MAVDRLDRKQFARYCEDLAAAYLGRRGYRLLARNFHARTGEIDIIARDGRELVFVEVKGKRSLAFGRPGEMVDRRKAGRVIGAAVAWMAATGEWGACRFDVITVLAGSTGDPLLEHFQGAFGLDEV